MVSLHFTEPHYDYGEDPKMICCCCCFSWIIWVSPECRGKQVSS